MAFQKRRGIASVVRWNLRPVNDIVGVELLFKSVGFLKCWRWRSKMASKTRVSGEGPSQTLDLLGFSACLISQRWISWGFSACLNSQCWISAGFLCISRSRHRQDDHQSKCAFWKGVGDWGRGKTSKKTNFLGNFHDNTVWRTQKFSSRNLLSFRRLLLP